MHLYALPSVHTCARPFTARPSAARLYRRSVCLGPFGTYTYKRLPVQRSMSTLSARTPFRVHSGSASHLIDARACVRLWCACFYHGRFICAKFKNITHIVRSAYRIGCVFHFYSRLPWTQIGNILHVICTCLSCHQMQRVPVCFSANIWYEVYARRAYCTSNRFPPYTNNNAMAFAACALLHCRCLASSTCCCFCFGLFFVASMMNEMPCGLSIVFQAQQVHNNAQAFAAGNVLSSDHAIEAIHAFYCKRLENVFNRLNLEIRGNSAPLLIFEVPGTSC